MSSDDWNETIDAIYAYYGVGVRAHAGGGGRWLHLPCEGCGRPTHLLFLRLVAGRQLCAECARGVRDILRGR